MLKMKLTIIHPLFTVYGGAEKVVLDWFRELSKEHDVKLYTLYYDKCLDGLNNVFYASKNLPKMHSIFGFKINPFNKNAINILAKQIAESSEKDEIFLFTVFPSPLIIHEAIKINPSIKNNKIIFLSFEPDRILYYCEQKKLNLLPPDVESWKFYLTNLFLSKWRKIDQYIANNYVRKAITLSDFVTNLTKKIYPKLNVQTAMEMYVNVDNFKLFSKEQARKNIDSKYPFGLTNADFVVISVGRLEKSKGVEELFDVIDSINNEGRINVKLAVGGKGALFEKLRNRKQKNVFMLGFVPDELLSSLYCACNVFVFLGINETGGPLTLLEAMYAENLIVASNTGGPPELMENKKHGFLIDASNKSEIKNAIEECYKLWKNEECKVMVQDAKNKVVNRFSFKKNYSDLIKALKE